MPRPAPALGKYGSRGQVRVVARGCSLVEPVRQRLFFLVGQAAGTEELLGAFGWEPGGHVAALGDVHDLTRVLSDIVVGQEAEWGCLAGVVALGTASKHNRGDVFGEGDGFGSIGLESIGGLGLGCLAWADGRGEHAARNGGPFQDAGALSVH